jgi:hypothetical protein
MKYRGIKYNTRTWFTYDGKQASSYECKDKRLFKDLEVVSISHKKEKDLLSKIDEYLDQREAKLLIEELGRQGKQEYYEATYPGRYTGD